MMLVSNSADSYKTLVEKGMQASVTIRGRIGADFKSPLCIYKACEDLGVTVRFNDINMEGMYDRSPKPRIHVSALRPLARRSFTCAHELGHHIFGHGSSIDELRDDLLSYRDRPPNEILADSFAAFLLMPTLGLREAFSKRRLDPNKASPIDLYAISCCFGVGHSTLINHLAFSLGMLGHSRRDALGKITPKMIRNQVLGGSFQGRLVIADAHWSSPVLDVEEGDLIVLPSNVVVNASVLMPELDVGLGRVFRVGRAGISRAIVPGSNWATFIRSARRKYVGLAQYRHLEDSDE